MRNELIYFRESHKSKVLYSPQLFKVNGIPHEERLVNLCALLAQDEQDSQFTYKCRSFIGYGECVFFKHVSRKKMMTTLWLETTMSL